MEENDSLEEKDKALEEAFEELVNEEILIAKKNNKDEALIQLKDGKGAIVTVKIEKDTKPQAYRIFMQGHSLATIDSNGKYKYTVPLRHIDKETPSFSIARAVAIENSRRDRDKNPRDSSDLTKKELDIAMKEGRVEKIRTGREITSGEDFSLITNRMFGERTHEVYRVRGKGTHDFKYVAKTTSGGYKKFGGTTTSEGSNPQQQVYILKRDGTYEQKTVDHLLTNGKYAIATDLPDSTMGDRTRTLVGNKLPSGNYLFIEALDSRNSSASNNELVKELVTRGESQYDMEDIITSLTLSERIRGIISDDKISAEEVEFVLKLREKGLSDEEICDVADTVHDLKEQGLENTKIKAILDSVDTTANQIEEMERANLTEEQQKDVFKRMYEQNNKISFQDAVKDIKDDNSKKQEDEQEELYGQKRNRPF